MVVNQYPHKILFSSATDSTRDADGNWIAGTTGVQLDKDCRAEVNGSSGYIVSPDGSRIDFAWLVYLPLPVDPVAEGTSVTVKDGDVTIATDTVKRFSKGQLNARIWL